MAELRLVFQPAPDTSMTVRVDFSSTDGGMRSGGQPQPFTFQLRPEDYADIRWYLRSGMHVKRDRLASVRYSERVNSSKSSFSLQRTNRYGIVVQKRSHFQRDS